MTIARHGLRQMDRMKTNYSSNSTTGSPAIAGSPGIGLRSFVRGNAFTLLCALLILVTASARPARASDPVGIYAFVDKVVLEPSDSSPERIQVWGGFALAEGRGDTYAPAQRGCMYFKIKPGEEEICKKEWNDLKTIAGTAQIVAFGTRHKPKGAIRKSDAKPENPDVYPTGFGLTRIKERDYAPIKALLELQKSKPGKAASLPTAAVLPSSDNYDRNSALTEQNAPRLGFMLSDRTYPPRPNLPRSTRL
jgi:hypothetical protein